MTSENNTPYEVTVVLTIMAEGELDAAEEAWDIVSRLPETDSRCTAVSVTKVIR